MTYERAEKWIKYASWFLGISGLVVAMAALPATNIVALIFADGLFWPFDGAQTLNAPETRLVSAIGGGVMAGWAVAFWMLADQGFSIAPVLSRRIILTSIWVWFVVDSIASFAAGAPLNVASNLIYLAIFVVPLMRMAPSTSPGTQMN